MLKALEELLRNTILMVSPTHMRQFGGPRLQGLEGFVRIFTENRFLIFLSNAGRPLLDEHLAVAVKGLARHHVDIHRDVIPLDFVGSNVVGPCLAGGVRTRFGPRSHPRTTQPNQR
jgi:hypothetical protein